ncbi:MAG: peptidase M14 [Candidatus Latescibacterota bacterium]|nr:MAG: peptidase M14 [Candidatus Latescibacterota bacterium]
MTRRFIGRSGAMCVFCATVASLWAISVPAAANTKDWETYFEKSGGKATPRYEETIEYCGRLDRASRWIRYTTFGKTPHGRDLPLLIVSKHKVFSPDAADRIRRKGHIVVLIQAGIHSGEIAGKDAGLMLCRDIAITKELTGLLDHVTVLFIPIFNVDGHERFGPYNRINQNGPEEMGWRTTANNLNLNRDYLKADASEMQDWIRLFNAWLPEFFLDLHTTNGADYQYAVTYILDIHGNMAPSLTSWTRDVFLATVEKKMAEVGYPLSPYVLPVEWGNPKSGIIAWVSPPRFAQGYTSIQNRPGFLVEAHSRKTFSERVNGIYEILKASLELLNRERGGLAKAIRNADELSASRAFRQEPFPLRFWMDRSDSVMIDFKGVAYEEVESELSGGIWRQYSGEPETFRIPYFTKQKIIASAELPEAYIVPPEWKTVIERLELHGVELRQLDESVSIRVDSYRFSDVTWQERPYEGRHPVRFEIAPIEEERTYPVSSVIVDMNQRTARVAAHILEPEGADSYVYWGVFDAIFEQKEYTDSDGMEKLAREMLAADENLKKDFEEKKANDPEFARNPRRILNWFYERTPYWDSRKNVYPVGKIFDRKVLNGLRARTKKSAY